MQYQELKWYAALEKHNFILLFGDHFRRTLNRNEAIIDTSLATLPWCFRTSKFPISWQLIVDFGENLLNMIIAVWSLLKIARKCIMAVYNKIRTSLVSFHFSRFCKRITTTLYLSCSDVVWCCRILGSDVIRLLRLLAWSVEFLNAANYVYIESIF